MSVVRDIGRSGRVIGWYSIVNGVLVLLTVASAVAGSQRASFVGIAAMAVLGVASLACGIFGLRGNIWAYLVLLAVFAIQSVEVLAQDFFFSFVGPVGVRFGFGWVNPPLQININILAVTAFFLAISGFYNAMFGEVRSAKK